MVTHKPNLDLDLVLFVLTATLALLLALAAGPAWTAPVPFPKPEKTKYQPRRLLHSFQIRWKRGYVHVECWSNSRAEFVHGEERWYGRWTTQKNGRMTLEITTYPQRQGTKADLGKYRIKEHAWTMSELERLDSKEKP